MMTASYPWWSRKSVRALPLPSGRAREGSPAWVACASVTHFILLVVALQDCPATAWLLLKHPGQHLKCPWFQAMNQNCCPHSRRQIWFPSHTLRRRREERSFLDCTTSGTTLDPWSQVLLPSEVSHWDCNLSFLRRRRFRVVFLLVKDVPVGIWGFFKQPAQHLRFCPLRTEQMLELIMIANYSCKKLNFACHLLPTPPFFWGAE